MLRLYRLQNKSRAQWWVIANDEQEAKEYSVAHGRLKSVANCTWIQDQTDLCMSDNLGDILDNETEPAFLAKKIKLHNFVTVMDSIKFGKNLEHHAEWIILRR